jgi:hypothetical protein
VSDREVGWTYRARRTLEGKNDFRSFLVLKVAREVAREADVNLHAEIGVRPYRRSWQSLWLREKLPVLWADTTMALELRGAPKGT